MTGAHGKRAKEIRAGIDSMRLATSSTIHRFRMLQRAPALPLLVALGSLPRLDPDSAARNDVADIDSITPMAVLRRAHVAALQSERSAVLRF